MREGQDEKIISESHYQDIKFWRVEEKKSSRKWELNKDEEGKKNEPREKKIKETKRLREKVFNHIQARERALWLVGDLYNILR